MPIQESSLLYHNWSIYSQLGEEGVLDEILKRLCIEDGIFIEFSSFYNTYTSNVRFLAERGWQGIFIDAAENLSSNNKKKCQPYRFLPPILCLEEILYFKELGHLSQVQFIKDCNVISENYFDQIIQRHFQNKEIDVLSIDLAGLDFKLLEELQNRPKIIIINTDLSLPPL